MSRLTESQIKGLYEFTRKKYVRYKDVQVELVDHLASAIEELQEKDPNINFTKALYQVYEGFGITGFSKIVTAREKTLTKFWVKKVFKMVLSFFKPPLVFGTVGSMILIFQLLQIGILPVKALMWFCVLAFFGSIILNMSHQYIHEEKMNEYLYMKVFSSVSFSVLFIIYNVAYSMGDVFSSLTSWHPYLMNGLPAFITPIMCILIYLVTF